MNYYYTFLSCREQIINITFKPEKKPTFLKTDEKKLCSASPVS